MYFQLSFEFESKERNQLFQVNIINIVTLNIYTKSMEFIFFTKIRIERGKKKNEREGSGLSWFE